jgi:hypothetical protein
MQQPAKTATEAWGRKRKDKCPMLITVKTPFAVTAVSRGHRILSSVLSVIGGSGIISDSKVRRRRTCSSNNKGSRKG